MSTEANFQHERTVVSVNGLSVPIPAQVTLVAVNTISTVPVGFSHTIHQAFRLTH